MTEKDVIQPEHYQGNVEGYEAKECIVVMYEIFGKEAVIAFCKLNSYKYQYRKDKKGFAEQDSQKARWYLVVGTLLEQGRHINTALAYVRSEAYKKLAFPENTGDTANFLALLQKYSLGFLYEVTVTNPNENGKFVPIVPELSLICYEDNSPSSRTYFYA